MNFIEFHHWIRKKWPNSNNKAVPICPKLPSLIQFWKNFGIIRRAARLWGRRGRRDNEKITGIVKSLVKHGSIFIICTLPAFSYINRPLYRSYFVPFSTKQAGFTLYSGMGLEHDALQAACLKGIAWTDCCSLAMTLIACIFHLTCKKLQIRATETRVTLRQRCIFFGWFAFEAVRATIIVAGPIYWQRVTLYRRVDWTRQLGLFQVSLVACWATRLVNSTHKPAIAPSCHSTSLINHQTRWQRSNKLDNYSKNVPVVTDINHALGLSLSHKFAGLVNTKM